MSAGAKRARSRSLQVLDPPEKRLKATTGKCKATGKVKFRTEADAEWVLHKRQWRGKGEARLYQCPHCTKWHLTSRGVAA